MRGRPAAAVLASIVAIVFTTAPGSGAQLEEASLRCETKIASEHRLSNGYAAVLRRVALSTKRTLGVNLDEPSDIGYFSKVGLLIRGDAFELVVPERWRGRLAIAWGGSEPTTRLQVPACVPDDVDWAVFAGGYYVSKPACVRLVVKTEETEKKVRIGVGKACPGQDPPPSGP